MTKRHVSILLVGALVASSALVQTASAQSPTASALTAKQRAAQLRLAQTRAAQNQVAQNRVAQVRITPPAAPAPARTPLALKAKTGIGTGLGLEAEVPVNSRLRATVGLASDRVTAGGKYFVAGSNYVGGVVGFSGSGIKEGTALVGHRFDSSNFFVDVEGGLNFKNFGPTVGVGAGIKF